jgi:multiple sugar transport system substrate-binding protein
MGIDLFTVAEEQRATPLPPGDRTRRRQVLASAGASLAGAAALAACGIGGQAGSSGPSKVSGSVSLLYFTSTEPAIERMKRQEASFKEKYPEIHLTVEAQPTAFTQKITTLLAAGTPPNVHWMGLDFWRLVGQGVFVDLNPIIAKDKRFNLKEYYPPALQAFTWQDKLGSLPYGMNTHTMSFNKSLFNKEGIPLPTKDWTVQQFTEIARRFTKDTDGDGVVDQAGFGNWPHLSTTPYLFGGSLWDKGFTKSNVDSPQTVSAMEWLHEIQYSSRKIYPSTQMLQGTNLNRLMGEGRVAFYSTGRFGVPVLRQFTDLDWDMVVYPTGPHGRKATFMSGESFAMNAETKDREAAWKLMEHLCGRESQENFYLKEGNSIPAIKAVAESRGFSDAAPGKNHKAHLDSLEFGVQPNTHPVDPQVFTDIISPLWRDVVDGKIQPREMARQAAPRMTEALQQWKLENKR